VSPDFLFWRKFYLKNGCVEVQPVLVMSHVLSFVSFPHGDPHAYTMFLILSVLWSALRAGEELEKSTEVV
jgi:hypothetical protein